MKGISIPLPMGKIISDITYKVPKIVPSVKGNNPWDSSENLKPERVEVLDENEKKEEKNINKTERDTPKKIENIQEKKNVSKEIQENQKKNKQHIEYIDLKETNINKEIEAKLEKKIEAQQEVKKNRVEEEHDIKKEKKVSNEVKEEQKAKIVETQDKETITQKVEAIEIKRPEKKEIKAEESREVKKHHKKHHHHEKKEIKNEAESQEIKIDPIIPKPQINLMKAKVVDVNVEKQQQEKENRKSEIGNVLQLKKEDLHKKSNADEELKKEENQEKYEDKEEHKLENQEQKKEKHIGKPLRKGPDSQGFKTEKIKIIHRVIHHQNQDQEKTQEKDNKDQE